MPVSAPNFADRPATYTSWLLISAVLLVICRQLDPYLFAIAALAGFFVSVVLIAVAALRPAQKPLRLALFAALPATLSMLHLATFKWA